MPPAARITESGAVAERASAAAPRLILEVRWGKLVGVKAILKAGSVLRVGRTDLSDLALPHDGALSGRHFEIAWDGARAALRDLGSAGGTSLDGRALAEGEQAEIEHGGWITAGDSHFMVYVEGFTPGPEIEGAPRERGAPSGKLTKDLRRRERKARQAAERALSELRQEARRAPLYAVMDAARDDRVLELLREHVEAHRSLYDGAQGEALEDVAPYLVGPMREDSALLDKLVLEGWGKRWGIYCTSREPFAEVRRHFRRFLMVRLEDTGEPLYFRFYDPGVLRVFLRTCEDPQQEALLDGLGQARFESEEGGMERVYPAAPVFRAHV